jgi:hypothetical protein
VTSYNSTASVYNSLLGDDDVVRNAKIEQMSQAVFSTSPLGALGGYIIRPTKLISECRECSWVFEELSLGNSRGKKSAGEDLTYDLKTVVQ